jgi:hypothetical protein
MKTLACLTLLFWISACSPGESELHRFVGENGETLGVAYVEYFDGALFEKLRIESEGKTVFRIQNEYIIGPKEIEATVSKENLYGYKVELAKPNYLVLVMAAPDGHGISDNITIEWVKELKEFHLLKTP